MASKSYELETPSTAAEAEATPPTKDHPPDMKAPLQDQEKELQYIMGFKLYAVLLGVTFVAFCVMLDQTIIATAIPKISVQFHSVKDIGWYGSAYLLTNASVQPLTGKIYQYYSSKVVFLGCLGLFELGSLICGVAQSSKMFIVGRAIAGLGGAGLMIGYLTILSACAPVHKRPVYLGFSRGFASIAIVAGPLLGGVFTEYVSWRWCFFINLPLGAITAITLFFVSIPKSHVQSSTKATIKEQLQRLDLLGFASFTPAIIMLLLAVQWGGTTYAWNSATIIGLFCGSAGGLAVFGLLEKRTGDGAMLPLAIMRKRKVICVGVTTLLNSGGGILVAYYLPVWFQTIQGTTPTIGGVHLLPSIGAMVFGSMFAGVLVTRIGYFTPFSIVGCILSTIGAGLLVTLTPNSDAAMWAGFQVLTGIGRGLALQQSITAIQVALSPALLSVGNAFIVFAQLLGSTLFISFGQTLFTNQLKTSLAHFAPTVDAEKILAVGATAFRTVVTPSEVPAVLLAYNQALTRIYYLSVGAGCVSVVTSAGMGWTNIKKLKEKQAVETEVTLDKV